MVNTRRLVIDVLKPHDPPTLAFAEAIAELDGIDGVNVVLVEVDEEVENIKLTIEGEDITFEAVESAIDRLGGTIHSIDMVASGDRVVEESVTPQD